MDFDCQGRDGCFDEDQLLAVYSRSDVEALMARLFYANRDSIPVNSNSLPFGVELALDPIAIESDDGVVTINKPGTYLVTVGEEINEESAP